jgi:hypothetical protein
MPTFAKRTQLTPHVTSGVLWCQKIPGKWSPCSPRVGRESKVRMREEKEDKGGWFASVFSFIFRFVF